MRRPAASHRRRAALRAGGALALTLVGAGPGRGASLVAVRVWPAADYTRVTLESDTALTQRHFLTDNPPRLVIDVNGLELSPALRELVGQVRPDDPFIAGLRAGQNLPRVVRLVIDLKQPVAPQLFALAPVAAYRHRLVFDLYPTHEHDPLLALIRDKQLADQRAAASAPAASGTALRTTPVRPPTASGSGAPAADSLGDFIDQLARPPATRASGNQASTSGGAASARAAASSSVAGALTASAPSASAASAPASAGRPQLPPALQGRIDRLIVVAIDPGHGGEDPGATGPSGLREKDVVLALALQLRDQLNTVPNLRAMLTRDGDFFVPLHERVRKARRVQADLFLSLHADAFITPQARGASVFALSEGGATSAAARWMANRENAADAVGGVNIDVKDAAVLRALLDMSTTAQIRDSLRLGGEVLGQIGRVGRLHKGSVEQAGFAVLKAPDIPSILVESAFISNPEEEDRLRDPDYLRRLVLALSAGIQRYFAKNPPLARSRQL